MAKFSALTDAYVVERRDARVESEEVRLPGRRALELARVLGLQPREGGARGPRHVDRQVGRAREDCRDVRVGRAPEAQHDLVGKAARLSDL